MLSVLYLCLAYSLNSENLIPIPRSMGALRMAKHPLYFVIIISLAFTLVAVCLWWLNEHPKRWSILQFIGRHSLAFFFAGNTVLLVVSVSLTRAGVTSNTIQAAVTAILLIGMVLMTKRVGERRKAQTSSA